ncbi:FGGY family carbohydrate kinase [Oscillospiraceae bacterium MB08-C2-2]|nr:FGGY family carbohydrate kinase [Oscillospiraceae bacterium MB08-C2-2]
MEGYLGIDIGTTNCKVGLFDETGATLTVESCPSPVKERIYYDMEAIWASVMQMLKNITSRYPGLVVKSIGITGMAEGGLLVDPASGQDLCDMMPWYFAAAIPVYDSMRDEIDDEERFYITGLHNYHKYSFYKLMYLQKVKGMNLQGTKWLSPPDYICYRLTGEFLTDYTLALRTYCFNINTLEYDQAFMEKMGLPTDIFARAKNASSPSDVMVKQDIMETVGLSGSIPVNVSGHDHWCSAVAVGAVHEEDIFASMGTAQAILGNFKSRPLTRQDYERGFSFGLHVLEDRMTWLGSVQASGGSMEWIREILDLKDRDKDYSIMMGLMEEYADEPSGILYYPYLVGRGAPRLDGSYKGSFIGLERGATRGRMLKAVMEGIAYETRYVLEAVEGGPGNNFMMVGGGTRNKVLMHSMSDITGIAITIPEIQETTCLGAALVGAGKDMKASFSKTRIEPDAGRHPLYDPMYQKYLELGRILDAAGWHI